MSCMYWQKLNLAAEPKIAINISRFKFGGLVQDRHTYMYNIIIMQVGKFGGCNNIDGQTAKFNSLPNFLAIR